MIGKHRILTIAHGHPDFCRGGGEIAAGNLHEAYSEHPLVEQSILLARHDRGKGATGRISMLRPGHYLWEQTIGDWFRYTAAEENSVFGGFTELLRRFRPTVVHLHHYVHLGLEMLIVIRQECPDAKVLLTLHEFAAICARDGQMMKTGGNRLCFRSGPEDCRQCFPERSPEDFWLRKHRFQSFFRNIDMFIAPSEFLRQRYISWGIPQDQITVIENGQIEREPLAPRELVAEGRRNRFGFFGQVTPFKGLDVLLRALNGLPRKARRNIVLEVNGANLEAQQPELRERIQALLKPLQAEGVVQWLGPYEPTAIADRMATIDWVLVPSIWWENSPMVIQEAFGLGRPVVCSSIGGMAEKVTDGIDGLHVPAGNPVAWGDVMQRLADQEPGYWEKLRAGIRKPLSARQCADLHLAGLSAKGGRASTRSKLSSYSG